MGVGGQDHVPTFLSPRKSAGAYFTGGWVGPWASLDGCGNLAAKGI
jgi:hypothetical protein